MRVAGYVRVSTEDQAREGFSLEGQRRAIDAYAASRGWAVAHWYEDAGVSAFTDDPRKRPAFAAMLADVAARRWDALIVLKLDRFARSVRVSADTLGYLRDHGCALISIAEGYDFGSVSGQFMYHIMAAIAQLESQQTSERVKRGLAVRAATGRHNTTPPWGSLMIDGYLTIDPAHAETMAFLLDRLATDAPSAVAALLNARGVTTRRGHWWTWKAVHEWLKAADWLLRQPSPWPERVALARARPLAHRTRGAATVAMTTGLLWCACGGRIETHSTHRTATGPTTYLRCLHVTPARATGRGCPYTLRPRQFYEERIHAWIATLPDIAAVSHLAPAADAPDRADLARRRRLLGLALADDTLDEATYRQRLAALRREEAALAVPGLQAALLAPLRQLREHGRRLTPAAQHAVLRLLVDRCVVAGDAIDIRPSVALATLLDEYARWDQSRSGNPDTV